MTKYAEELKAEATRMAADEAYDREQIARGNPNHLNKQSASLMELLLSGPDNATETIQEAIRAVAIGDWTRAGRLVGYAADATDEGDAWGDLAATVAAELRAKANT